MYDNAPDRFPAQTPPQVSLVRALPNTYEVDAFGSTYSTAPIGRWQRGEIERGAMPAVMLTSPTPMYDPSDLEQLNRGFGGAN